MKIYCILLILMLFSCKKYKLEQDDFTIRIYSDGNGVTDIDGNTYKTVIIGDQEWMAENLKVTKLNDGTPIAIFNDTIDNDYYYTWTKNDNSFDSLFGKLYSQRVARQNVCPSGWHVPTQEDWLSLIDYVCPANMIGKKMKSIGILNNGTGLWDADSNNSTNETEFNALPSGVDSSTIYKKSFFWTSTIIEVGKYYTPYIIFTELSNDNDVLKLSTIGAYAPYYYSTSFSIRCVKN